MCISHTLDARVAALRAAVGCGWTYRRGAAWAWRAIRPSVWPATTALRASVAFEKVHEACETVLDGFHAFLRTQYAMRQAEGAARGVTSLH